VPETNDPYVINESGYVDDAGFREPSFFAELARASAAAPVATIPVARAAEPDEESEASQGPDGQLAIDVYQTPTDIIIMAPIAGVAKPEHIEINISHDVVTIRGERKPDVKVAEADYLYQECYWGRFSRSVVLPQEVDADAAVANFSRNGILSLRLPKLVRERARKIAVRFS